MITQAAVRAFMASQTEHVTVAQVAAGLGGAGDRAKYVVVAAAITTLFNGKFASRSGKFRHYAYKLTPKGLAKQLNDAHGKPKAPKKAVAPENPDKRVHIVIVIAKSAPCKAGALTSEQIEHDTEVFLQRGGRIQRFKLGETSQPFRP